MWEEFVYLWRTSNKLQIGNVNHQFKNIVDEFLKGD
jgi:hypothetical protein